MFVVCIQCGYTAHTVEQAADHEPEGHRNEWRVDY